MKCIKCGRDTFLSRNTEAIEMENGCLLVIRHIPCYECSECAEMLYTDDVAWQLEQLTDRAKSMVQEFAVVDYTKVM